MEIPSIVTNSNNSTEYTVVSIKGGEIVDGCAFREMTGITSVTIPATVRTLDGVSIFYGCTGLKQVFNNGTMTLIEGWTFYGCTSLKYCKIPATVVTIGQSSFQGCTSLTSITIPASVNQFGEDVFNGCTALQSFYYLGTSFPITFENGNLFYNIENGDDKRPKIYTKPGYVENMKTSLNEKCDWLKSFVFDAIPYTPAKDYTTFCRDFDVDFSAATGLKAGVALSDAYSAGNVTFTVKESVPAYLGVLLKGTAGETYSLKIAESAPDPVYDSPLKGVVFDITLPQEDGGNTNFVLSNGTFKKVNSIGNTIPAGKAYLQLPTSTSSARDISFSFDDEPTGINKVQGVEQKDDSYYNLQGQRVSQPMKGLYIINGKKVVVK